MRAGNWGDKMIDYTIPLLLTVCGIGLAIIGAFFYAKHFLSK